jgi:hypothetical protein
LSDGHLEGAELWQAHLEGTFFEQAFLDGAFLGETHLAGGSMAGTRMKDTYLVKADLGHTDLGGARLERANLNDANLEHADLSDATLNGASLELANLEYADLSRAHLEDANLDGASLVGTTLRAAWLDSKSILNNVALDKNTRLGDIQWSGVGSINLTQIDWSRVPYLGDEQGIGLRARASDQDGVVRAYRQLAAQLRVQGLSEAADRFAYRSNMRQRRVYLRRFRILQYLGSLFLDLISGYGYRPARSLFAYVLVILGFAATYFTLGGANGQTLSWNEAIVISMTAFHGRGFFSAVFQPGDLQAAVAAVEAFIGLLIEIVLIATFTQRFFAR